MYLDYRYLETGSFASTGIWHIVADYQYRFVLIYQFYFVLGALTALYLPQMRAFVLRSGKWVVGGLIVMTGAVWIHFFVQVGIARESVGYATSVLQPIMTFFSTAVILFLYWASYRWAHAAGPAGRPKGYMLWHMVSDASFGIYLIHALILTVALRWVVPVMPLYLPVAVRVFCTWCLVAGTATMLSVALTHLPLVSRLVGREGPQWLSGRFDRRQQFYEPVGLDRR